MAKMKTGAPAQKVTAATAAAAFASVIVSIFSGVLPQLNEFQTEFITIITFIVGYIMPPSNNDQLEVDSGQLASQQ